MRTPETVYAGERLVGARGRNLGVKVTVDGKILSPAPSQRLVNHSPNGFEWGYRGSGPAQLALALVLDALAGLQSPGETARRALAAYQWFMDAVVGDFRTGWEITAGEVRAWVERCEAEESARRAAAHPHFVAAAVTRCRECGCTDWDCRECVAATGRPCEWVPGQEPPLCSRCADEQDRARPVGEKGGGS